MCENVDFIVIQPSIGNLGSSGHQLNRDILNSRSTTHTGDTHSCSIIRNAILYGSIPGHISDPEAVVHSRECHPACCTSVSHRYYKIHINPSGNLPPLCSNGNTASARALSIRLSNAKEGLRFEFREYAEIQASKQSRSCKIREGKTKHIPSRFFKQIRCQNEVTPNPSHKPQTTSTTIAHKSCGPSSTSPIPNREVVSEQEGGATGKPTLIVKKIENWC